MPSFKLRNVEGQILTIVEAAIADKQQCEAVKSLIRQAIGPLHSWTTTDPPKGVGSFGDTPVKNRK
ncbi:MAG: hypothetical protein NUV86_12655 [Candidatus Scalindua sp.]|nr:hypothetical protein [Candidatus Scalindua sp.]